VPVRYRAAGLDRPEAPIVFVHGWSNQWFVWQPHFDAFAKTHPVVAMDLPGFGESGRGRQGWSMEAFGEDVVAVLEDLDLQGAILVGYSMGSAAALEAALRAPERVDGVVLVDWLQNPERRYGAEVVDAFSTGD
jgi:pimeloyl-ACP methyl ester carboxylesterase